jgi:hypothetical protein
MREFSVKLGETPRLRCGKIAKCIKNFPDEVPKFSRDFFSADNQLCLDSQLHRMGSRD